MKRSALLTGALVIALAATVAIFFHTFRTRSRDARVLAAKRQAAEMVMVGDYVRAIAAYDAALKEQPGDAALLEARATLRYAAGEFAGAVADCDAAIAGGSDGAWATRGSAKAALGDLDGALADYGKALAHDPVSAPIWACKADALRRKGDLANALLAYDTALARDPGQAKVWRGRSETMFRISDFDSALADAEEAVKRDGTEPEGWFLVAVAKRGKGDTKGALAACDKALEVGGAGWGKKGEVEKWVEAMKAENRK